MNDSVSANYIYFVFWRGHSRDSSRKYYSTASWVLYDIHTAQYDYSPCAALGFPLSRTIWSNSMTNTVTAEKKKKGTSVVNLVHAEIGAFQRDVANQPHSPIYI